MALVLSGSIDISGSMTATTILVSSPGAAGMVSSSAQITELAPLMAYTASLKGAAIVSSSQQITNYYKFAETASANTFYGNQTISGSLNVYGDGLRINRTTSGEAYFFFAKNDTNRGSIYGNNAIDGLRFFSGDSDLALTIGPLTSVTASGNLLISNGNLVMGTSGKGIDFSATSNGSGTTSSELLNDYEEGTWTATLTCGTSGTITLASANSSCKYTKIGRLVNISGYIDVQSVSSPTGRLSIGGFPFTQISDGVPLNVAYINGTNAYTGFAIMLGNESNGAYIDRNANTGADAAVDLSSAIKAGTEIYFNLTYTTT